MNKFRKEFLWKHLSAIHERVQWMADEEARAAWVGGRAADGIFLAKKERLCDATDRILDELEQGLKMPKGPKGQKRPADVIGNAVRVLQIATGEAEEPLAPRKRLSLRRVT